MGVLDSPSLSMMNKTLDGLWKRMETVSDNIANIETPDYKRKTVSFENSLESAIKTRGKDSAIERQIDNINIEISEEADSAELDGNSVDLEQEQLDMIRTTYQYMYSQRVVSDYFSRLSTAINEGK